MATVTLEFYGEKQLNRTLDRYAEGAQDALPAWEWMADDFARIESAQFSSQGGYGSGGWPALSPRYAAWKARHYPGQPILQREGLLAASLTERPFGVEVLEPHRMVLGSDIDYGGHHQRGGGNLPRRRPVELPERDRRAWARRLQRYIVTGEVS